MVEEWKDIYGYEGLYQVSNLGRVKSLPRDTKNQYAFQERILKPSIDKDGYEIVGFGKKLHKVHRLVANAFIPKISGKEIINHKDGNKRNNYVNNLEWCTTQENIIHAVKTGLFVAKKGSESKNAIPIIIKNSYEELMFMSEVDASKFLSVGRTAISNCLKGRSKTCKGYEIRYAR